MKNWPKLAALCVLLLPAALPAQWAKLSDRAGAGSVLATPDGGSVLVGNNLTKLSADGQVVWGKSFDMNNPGQGGSIRAWLNEDGGCLAARAVYADSNVTLFQLSSMGAVEWQKKWLLPNSVVDAFSRTTDGGVILAGSTTFPSPGSEEADIILCKASSTGEILRQRAYPMAYGNLQGVTFTPTAGGGALLAMGGSAGHYDANTDVQLLRLGPSGDIEWQKIFGSDYSEDAVWSLHQMSDGDFFFVGSTASWTGGGSWYMRLTPDGSLNPYCVFVKSANSAVMEETSSPTEVEATVVNTSAVPVDIGGTAEPGNIGFGFVTQGDFTVLGTPTATLTMVDNDGTTTPANGLHVYDTGTRVMISASPPRGYRFSSWFGNIYIDKSPVSVLMDGDKRIVDNYAWVGWDENDGGGESGCFIATAAYGSALDPHVETLRAFRDKYLLKSRFGKAIVNLYYKLSPPLARLIASDPILKAVSRLLLYPVVLLSRALL